MAAVNNKFQIPLLPLLLLAVSLAFNLHALAADSFWGDEILTAIFAGRPPAELMRWTAQDIHPPLYYLLAGTFTRLIVPLGQTGAPGPASDWLWRFPSVIAGVLTVAVTYRLADHLSRLTFFPTSSLPSRSRLIALSAALLMSLAPVAIKYSQEARMHALFMFLSILSTWLFFQALAHPRQWSRWLAFSLATAANIYTMYFGFLILAAQAVLLLLSLVSYPDRRAADSAGSQRISRLLGFGAAAALAGLLYLPWWPVLFNILSKRAAMGAIEGGVGSPWSFIPGVVQALGPAPAPAAWGFFLLFGAGIVFLARSYWPLALFAGLWLLLPAVLPVFLGDPRALQFRYAFILPLYLIVITWAVATISRRIHQHTNLFVYLIWLLATVSLVATLAAYRHQIKPDWRSAAAYLEAHTTAADIILIGPLWDEGRFIDYYYQGQAQLLTPAALVTNIESRLETMRASGGRIWAVNRFAPAQSPVSRNIVFPGVILSEPTIAVYEPDLVAEAALDLAAQAVEAAYGWAAQAEAQGVLNPDPRTAQAAALRAWGDTLVAAGRPQEALVPYQRAVDIFPGWVDGYLTLAQTQELVGNLPAAVKAYRQAVAFNLAWQGAQADQAAALAEAGRWEAALEKYHHLIEEK